MSYLSIRQQGKKPIILRDRNVRITINSVRDAAITEPLEMQNLSLVFDGNSITSYGYPALISPSIPSTAIFRSLNRGLSGQQASTLQARASTDIDPLIVAGKHNILVILEITNSIQLGGTARSAANDLFTYCDARRAAGWTVVVCTAPPLVSSLVATAGTLVVAANALVRSEWPAHADILCDLRTIPQFDIGAAAPSTTLFYDLIHPTAFGQQLIADKVAQSIRSLRNKPVT
jgi:hypothetical protein